MAEIFEKPPEVGGHYEPLGKAELVDHNDHRLRLRAGSATVEITALAPDLFRVGKFPKGRTPDYGSEAIAKLRGRARARTREPPCDPCARSRRAPRLRASSTLF